MTFLRSFRKYENFVERLAVEKDNMIRDYFDARSHLVATVTYASVSHGVTEIRFDEGDSPFLGARLTLFGTSVFSGDVPQFGPSRFDIAFVSDGVAISSQCGQFRAQAQRVEFDAPKANSTARGKREQ